MTELHDLTLDDLVGEAPVRRLYSQVFAVLAHEAGAMIEEPSMIDVDEAILEAFAEAGSEGMTVEMAVSACRRWDRRVVTRRFEVLREYEAINKVADRPHELYHRAAFAPYVMLLFLRRMAEQGGQSELHQLLSMEQLAVDSANTTVEEGRDTVRRLTKVFRLLGNELSILAIAGTAETLGDNAQLIWGNNALIVRAEKVHATALRRWPALHRDCAALRAAFHAYADASEAAAARLLTQAGTTRALGLLPVEVWRSFARKSTPNALAAVLDRFVFDAPAPWFSPQALVEGVESGRQVDALRIPPPRPDEDDAPPDVNLEVADDVEELRAIAEQVLAGGNAVDIAGVLSADTNWLSARRLLAELTAIHHHPELDYEIAWGDELRVQSASSPTWMSCGKFRRTSDWGDDA